MIEFMKLKEDKSNAPAIKFDEAKVKYCTCRKAPLCYKTGATVLLGEKSARVKVFEDAKEDDSFDVDKN